MLNYRGYCKKLSSHHINCLGQATGIGSHCLVHAYITTETIQIKIEKAAHTGLH